MPTQLIFLPILGRAYVFYSKLLKACFRNCVVNSCISFSLSSGTSPYGASIVDEVFYVLAGFVVTCCCGFAFWTPVVGLFVRTPVMPNSWS